MEYLIENFSQNEVDNYDNNDQYYGQGLNNKTYIDNFVEYIAGFVIRILLKHLRKCYYCPLILTEGKSTENLENQTLLQRKVRGK